MIPFKKIGMTHIWQATPSRTKLHCDTNNKMFPFKQNTFDYVHYFGQYYYIQK